MLRRLTAFINAMIREIIAFVRNLVGPVRSVGALLRIYARPLLQAIVYAAAIAGVAGMLWGLEAFWAILGVSAALLALFVILMLTAPLYALLLLNKPNTIEGEKGSQSGPHFFTTLAEGQEKLIIRGERPMYNLLKDSSHRFVRSGTVVDETHWAKRPRRIARPAQPARQARRATATRAAIAATPAVNAVRTSEPEEDIFHDMHHLVQPWARYVYEYTGAVFTGIWPFQKVREAPLERTMVERVEDKERNLVILKLKTKHDFTDHFRTREFLVYVLVINADTQDSIPVNLLFQIRVETENAYLGAYHVDRWDQKLNNLATNAIINHVRIMRLEQVISAVNATQASGFREAIRQIVEDELGGFNMISLEMLGADPVLNEEEKTRLHAEALARRTGAATRIEYDAQAYGQRELQNVVIEGGDTGLAIAEIDARRRAITEAKDATVFVGGGDANLATLQDIKRESRNRDDQGQGGGNNASGSGQGSGNNRRRGPRSGSGRS